MKEEMVLLVAFICLVLGGLIGAAFYESAFNVECADLGKSSTNKYILTCEQKKSGE